MGAKTRLKTTRYIRISFRLLSIHKSDPIELNSGTRCAKEIGNMFNEIKPYFVSPECFTGGNFTYDAKLFYIPHSLIPKLQDLNFTLRMTALT